MNSGKLTKKNLEELYGAIMKGKPHNLADRMIANFSKENIVYFKSTTKTEMPFGLPVIQNKNMELNTFIIVDKKGRSICMGRI